MSDFKEMLVKDMMKTLSEHSINGVYIADSSGIIYINDGFANMFGYSRDDILSSKITWRELIIVQHFPILQSISNKVIEGDMISGNVKLAGLRKNGELIYLNFLITSDIQHNQNIIVGSIVDNTEEMRIREQLGRIKYYDDITGFPNRRMFIEQLDKQFMADGTKSANIAMILINVKRFKLINNSLGHDIGDLLMQQFGVRLKKCVMRDQTTIYRIAGDKFCIVLFDAGDRQDVISFSQRIIEKMSDEFVIEDYRLNIKIDIGISMTPHDGSTVDSLFRAAETALYFSEATSSEKVHVYSSELSVQTFRKFSLINDLPKALESQQLFIQFMPRVDARTARIVGSEALIRWKHPDWGIVSPAEFIPIAEETGLIIQIGEWVLREACIQNKAWMDKGYNPITVSVNFSASQLLQDNILHMIDQTLEETCLSPAQLEIELTESVYFSNEEKATQLLLELKRRNIKVALDDFGTGYSSLYSLKTLKVDTIKIDRSFIQEVFTDSVSQSIVQNIISLAKELEMGTVAEGVETADQYTFMKELQCEEIQGYYFSSPLDADQLAPLLEQQYIDRQRASMKRAEPNIEQREHPRIELASPLIAKMTIIKFKGDEVELGATDVFVKNMSSSGLHFLTGVKLPINDDIVLQFTLDIMGELYKFQGNITWSNDIADGDVYEYGVRFI